MVKSTVLVLALVAAAVPLRAQDPPLHFDVASIKPSGPVERGVSVGPTGFQPGGRYVARNMSAERLLVLAFREEGTGTGLRPEQIVGAPAWLGSTLYSIDAKVAGPATAERIVDPQAARLLRSLLEERFKLTFHYEQRELPFYALLVAKADGSIGPTLTRSALDCDAIAREREAARLANRPAAIPAPVGGRPICAVSLTRGIAIGAGATLTTVASVLTGAVGSTVLDRTGLSGAYDIELHYAPDTPGGGADAANPDAPSIFTAVREHLGLKLEMRREMRPVLVIDHVEKPTPD